jgi:hypothetical protein
VHPTGGSRRVFRHSSRLEAGSVKVALSHPTHQRVTPAVRQPAEKVKSVFDKDNDASCNFIGHCKNRFMDKDSTPRELLLIGIPLEWQSAMKSSLENAQLLPRFSLSKEDAIDPIQTRDLIAIVITSDFVFDGDLKQDVIALTYRKIPTLTIILQETFQAFGQEKVFDKVYNPEAFQEFCTAPFDMDELLPRLQKIIQKAQKRL